MYQHQQQLSSEESRQNRFFISGIDTPRSASQPPRPYGSGDGYLSSAAMQIYGSPTSPTSTTPWVQRVNAERLGATRSSSIGVPGTGSRERTTSSPVGVGSFSTHSFATAMRESRSFGSTLEDDESGENDAVSLDEQDYHSVDEHGQYERFVSASLPRGRAYLSDLTRSRSQSLATPVFNWSSTTSTSPLDIPRRYAGANGHYGDLKSLGTGSLRYGSLGRSGGHLNGGSAVSPVHSIHARQSRLSQGGAEISNISPFVRDVGQILLDEGSAIRELWGAMPPPAGDGGTTSGTTSRRHSVSIVQPRRGVVGFNAPEADEGISNMNMGSMSGRRGLMISDEDLAADLGGLLISSGNGDHQPSSLPASAYAPLARTLNEDSIAFPRGGRNLHSPSDHDSGSDSPGRHRDGGIEFPTSNRIRPPDLKTELTQDYGRFIPGSSPTFSRGAALGLNSPLSPTAGGVRSPQQSAYYPKTTVGSRRASSPSLFSSPLSGHTNTSTHHPPPSLHDLGKGIPLSNIPSNYPLFIVEFKAGRTDLFYSTDPAANDMSNSGRIKRGDLVIVEADRGKDLGKVVNDTITVAEVERWLAGQRAGAQSAGLNNALGGFAIGGFGFGDDVPQTPTTTGSGGKKDISPKRIYGKAGPEDTQLLISKMQDEAQALQLCQNKVRQKKLPMEVIDAEYQWDRRKLTFYFIAEKRIDFRELVRELFRLYKTRIWMASLQGPGGSSEM